MPADCGVQGRVRGDACPSRSLEVLACTGAGALVSNSREGCVPKGVRRRVRARIRGMFGRTEDSGGGESGGPDSSWNGYVCFTEGLREPNVAVYTEQAMRYLTLFWSFSFNNSRTLFLSSAIMSYTKGCGCHGSRTDTFSASGDGREHLSYVLLQSVTGFVFE